MGSDMKTICIYVAIALCAITLASTASPLLAQEPAPIAAPAGATVDEPAEDAKPVDNDTALAVEEASTAADDMKSIGGMIVSGGTLNVLFFGILGLFSLWAATVVLERLVNLRQETILPSGFVASVQVWAKSSTAKLSQLQAICDGKPSPATRVLRAGVIRAGRPMSEVEKGMEDAVSREMTLLRSRYKPLNVVGNISPLVGLLGTVVGMIMAFQISSQAGLGKAEQLAEGIYLALMTTAAGLSLAIPCLLFASWFQSRGERYMGNLCDVIMETLPHFARLESHSPAISNRLASALHDRVELSLPSTEESSTAGPSSVGPNTMGDRGAEQEPIDGSGLSVRERFLRDGVFDPVKG